MRREIGSERLILLHDGVLGFLIFLVATVAASDQRRMGDGEWAEVNIGAAIGHFHFELKRGARTGPYDMHDRMYRAAVRACSCSSRRFNMSATTLFLDRLTVLMPTVVHPVAVMAGYDIVLHPKIYIHFLPR